MPLPAKNSDMRLTVLAGFLLAAVLQIQVLQYLAARFYVSFDMLVAAMGIIVGFGCFLYLNRKKQLEKNELPYAVLYLVIVVMFGSGNIASFGFQTTAGSVFYGFWILACYFMARLTLKYSRVAQGIVIISFLLFVISYLHYVYPNWELRAVGFFEESSYNIISAIMIFLLGTLLIVCAEMKKLAFAATIVTAIICAMLGARSSIVISLALLIWCVMSDLRSVYGWIFAAALASLAFYLQDLVADIYYQSKFFSEGLDSPRWEMMKKYITQINGRSLFFGVDLASVEVIRDYNNNPHNSFIDIHSRYGLLGLLYLAGFLLANFTEAGVRQIGIVLVLLFRASADVLIFPGLLLDYYLFLAILYRKPSD